MMQKDTAPSTELKSTAELRTWRTKLLNTLLTITVVAAIPVIIFVTTEAIEYPEQWPAALIFWAIFLLVVVLAFFRRLNYHLRAWSVLLLGYAAGGLAFVRGGLAGDGRVYFLALPALAVILLGLRAGVITTALSLLTFAFLAAAAHMGWMANWLVAHENPLHLKDWAVGGIVFGMFLLTLVTMQWHFYRFLTALAAEKSRLFHAEHNQRELAEALEEAAAVVSGTLDIDEVLDHILEQVERVMPGDAFNIMLVENSHVRMVRRRGYDQLEEMEWTTGRARAIDQFPGLVKMMQTGEPIVIPDTATSPNWGILDGQDRWRSYVAAPIQVTGLIVGFLNVNGNHPGQFSTADAQRLKAFAHHAATAIQNAQLYRELHSHAEQLEERVRERTAQLRAQYAQLDAILRSTADGIVVTDEKGEIILANPVAQMWLTQPSSPEDARLLHETVHDLATRAHEQPEQVLGLAGIDLQLRVRPISEAGSGEAAAVVNLEDVSHLKELDRLKSRFVSNVSHELRTPITTIKLYTEILREKPEDWEECLDRMEHSADRQTRLVEDLLQISRIEAGQMEMELRPTPLNELTDIAVVSHQALAESQGLMLKHLPAEPAPIALVDPERVMQVLTNLVANAIQYTKEGGQVTVSTGIEEVEGHAWATATVVDTGIGIPNEELPHIFERFFRGNEPRLMDVPGTGLGLAIVKEILDLHGGKVTVESQAGEGSAFTVWLPLAGE